MKTWYRNIRLWIRKALFLVAEFPAFASDVDNLQEVTSYLLQNSNRQMRRRWKRITQNPRSPFYQKGIIL